MERRRAARQQGKCRAGAIADGRNAADVTGECRGRRPRINREILGAVYHVGKADRAVRAVECQRCANGDRAVQIDRRVLRRQVRAQIDTAGTTVDGQVDDAARGAAGRGVDGRVEED